MVKNVRYSFLECLKRGIESDRAENCTLILLDSKVLQKLLHINVVGVPNNK